MREGGRLASVLIALALAPAVMAAAPSAPSGGPASDQALHAALTGSIEALPGQWGGQPIDGAPPPQSAAQSASLLDTPLEILDQLADQSPLPAVVMAPPPLPPAPLAAAPSAPDGPRAADEVGGLVVQAPRLRAAEQTVEKCITGPAWWRISKGASVLWLMPTPDLMPMDTVWDDTCLRKRLAAARVLILPAEPKSQGTDPFARANTPLRALSVPLNERLPADLWARLGQRIDNSPVRDKAELDWIRIAPVRAIPPGIAKQIVPAGFCALPCYDRTYYAMLRRSRTTLQVLQETPNLFAPVGVVSQRLALSLDFPGRLGNPAADHAADLAGKANMLATRTRNSQTEFASIAYLTAPGETDQQACLRRVLDEMDAGHDAYGKLQQIESWADGDYANGLRRMNVFTTCPFGDLSVRFWSALVAQDMQLIERNMAQPGVVVAVLEYDPLFLKGGVMERLAAAGFTIAPPEALR
ncbi:MAG: hypothetical protein JWM33_37 [Caulobacteraceae bacterium]|nr:hypothetical protein [Caulobacteraceae bacterium]